MNETAMTGAPGAEPAAGPPEDPRPVAPCWPDDGACCGNGCDPCIYDLYAIEEERYRRALRAWEQRHGVAPSGP